MATVTFFGLPKPANPYFRYSAEANVVLTNERISEVERTSRAQQLLCLAGKCASCGREGAITMHGIGGHDGMERPSKVAGRYGLARYLASWEMKWQPLCAPCNNLARRFNNEAMGQNPSIWDEQAELLMSE